jgi:hypothetical protein
MKIRSSFLTLVAGTVLSISTLGISVHSITAAPSNGSAKITAAHQFAITDDGTDGSDPWPKPTP